MDRSSLSKLNWTLLSNVVHAFDNFIHIPQTRQTIEYLSVRPIDMSQIFSMFATFYASTESFISSSADFQILTIEEKCSLYQRNLHGVLHLTATLILYLSGMFESSLNGKLLISSYGYDTFQQTKRIASQLDYDLTMIKLFLLILAFSSNCYTVDIHENMHNDRFSYGTFRLFGSQNAYVEVLWKYMIYRYDYYDASLRFARLIKHMLDLLKISENAQQNNEIHRNFVDEISEITEKSLIINENEVVPLWGKT
jgi:hypothetical protein